MLHEREATRSVIPRPLHPRRRLLAACGCAAGLLLSSSRLAAAASAEDCRMFERECTEAKAAGYSEVGICNVERLECPPEGETRAPRRSQDPGDDGDDRERSNGDQRR